jgi:hypothetical protein
MKVLSDWVKKKVAIKLQFLKIIRYCFIFSIGSVGMHVNAGVFGFASDINIANVVTHPVGYQGVGGELVVTVGISPASPHAAEMLIPIQNAINTWNRLQPTLGNLDNNIPRNQFDFESVALHELGHCIGLAHPNLASESGLAGINKNFTRTTRGLNNVFDINRGGDGVIGSSDDVRGDDINLHWFRKADNNPFAIDDVVDKTTYSRHLSDLPADHLFVANGDRDVAALLGVPNTESVMQQGIFAGETRRFLSADDVATLRLGMSGLDMIAGTADDYTVTLRFDGFTDVADIVFNFDDMASFAACSITGNFINPNHLSVESGARISFNTGFSWFFNDQSTPPIPPENANPAVTILANNTADAVTLKQGELLSLAVILDPGVRAGTQADYWVWAITPQGTFWLDAQLQFINTVTAIRVFGGSLDRLSDFTFFSRPTTGLPPGTYTFTFAIDDNMDGIVNGTFKNSVAITIEP